MNEDDETWGKTIQSQEYWDTRYVNEKNTTFEWYCDYEQIGPLLEGKRRRSNVAVIIDRIVFVSSFLFYCLLYNHSFQTNPNRMTNCFKLFLFITTLQLQLHCSCIALGILPKSSSILEIGCGNSELTLGLHHAGYTVIGTDYAAKQIEHFEIQIF